MQTYIHYVAVHSLSGSSAKIRDVPDIRLARYPAIFSNPVPALVPAKTVPGTGYLSWIVLGPFWQLVELNSPSEWAPYCKHVGYKL